MRIEMCQSKCTNLYRRPVPRHPHGLWPPSIPLSTPHAPRAHRVLLAERVACAVNAVHVVHVVHVVVDAADVGAAAVQQLDAATDAGGDRPSLAATADRRLAPGDPTSIQN